MVDLTEVIWPREKPVHTLRNVLYCARCKRERGQKRRHDLIGLRVRQKPEPEAPYLASRNALGGVKLKNSHDIIDWLE